MSPTVDSSVPDHHSDSAPQGNADSLGIPHLRVHSHFSLRQSLLKPAQIAQVAAERRIPAVALTDTGNLFGFVKFFEAMRRVGVQPICGVEIEVTGTDSSGRSLAEQAATHIGLLVRNETGYLNLCKLLSEEHSEYDGGYRRRIDIECLTPQNTSGLIALSGGLKSDVARALLAGRSENAEKYLDRWRGLFADFFIEINRLGLPQEEEYIAKATDLADRTKAHLVATQAVCYASSSHFKTHEIRVRSARNELLEQEGGHDQHGTRQWLMSSQDMRRLYENQPEALENARAITQLCVWQPNLDRQPMMPDFQLQKVPKGPKRQPSQKEILQSLVEEGWKQKSKSVAKEHLAEYEQRLRTEMDVILGMGYEGYFCIVADFTVWARKQSIPVGPGRGSGVGSIVAWCLGITAMDPIRHGLLFERFLNPERVSLPDFDIDFCTRGRDEVIKYVIDRYGADRVAGIAVYHTYGARAAVQAAGRTLAVPYPAVRKITELLPSSFAQKSIAEAIKDSRELQRLIESGDNQERDLLEVATQLEGIVHSTGKHPAGIVISNRPLHELLPVCQTDSGELPYVHLDLGDVERLGLVKFDFLGLNTLTALQDACDSIQTYQPMKPSKAYPSTPEEIPEDDLEVLKDLSHGNTIGVFQLEQASQRNRIIEFGIQEMNDLFAINGLIRPGPLQGGAFDQAVARKQTSVDQWQDELLHPDLMDILSETWGVMIYQEQAMEVARKFAGFSYGQADILRRAIGKKNEAEMGRSKKGFIEGGMSRGYKKPVLEGIFDLIDKFSAYGFNKSHSVAYGQISYWVSWLKAHHPAAVMGGLLTQTGQAQDGSRLSQLYGECLRLGVEVLPPCVNHSQRFFTATQKKQLRWGLCGIKDLSHTFIEQICQEQQNRPFDGEEDFAIRGRLHQRSFKEVDRLLASGALRSLGLDGHCSQSRLVALQKQSELHWKERESGQKNLFGSQGDDSSDVASRSSATLENDSPQSPSHPRRPFEECSKREFEALGLWLSHHPLEMWRAEASQMQCTRLSNLPRMVDAGRPDVINGLIAARVLLVGKVDRRQRIPLLLDDGTGIPLNINVDETVKGLGEGGRVTSDQLPQLLAEWQGEIILAEITGKRFAGRSGSGREIAYAIKSLRRLCEERKHRCRELIIAHQGPQDGFNREDYATAAFKALKICQNWAQETQESLEIVRPQSVEVKTICYFQVPLGTESKVLPGSTLQGEIDLGTPVAADSEILFRLAEECPELHCHFRYA